MLREAHKWFANGTQGTRQPIYKDFPTYFDRAKGCRMWAVECGMSNVGCRMWDVDGNEFIDLLCSIGPVILGYSYKPVDDAVIRILRSSFQSSTNHPIQFEVARRLVETVPSAERVRFLKTGTEATVAAARLARQITGRMWIARSGYHGWADLWRYGEKGGTQKEAWEVVPSFDGSAENLERLFKKTRKKFGVVILCPADTRPFTTENYQNIIEVAHRHGALVIFDEIKTGFRTALGGAQEVLGVTPDLTTLSKGLGNGYPIAAVVGKKKYMERWDETPTSGTFFVEASSLAATNATLKTLQEKPVVEHLWKRGEQLINGLNKICEEHGMEEPKAIADPTPSMPRFTWHVNEFNRCDHLAHQYFFGQCLRYGLYFCPWHVAFINYSHRKQDIDEALEISDFVMGKTKKNWRTSKAKMTI